MSDDALFDARNNFHLGHYQGAITDATNAAPRNDAQQLERDVLLYRAYIEQGKATVVTMEINDSSPPALRAVRLLAQYKSGDESARQAAVASLRELLTEVPPASDTHLSAVAASIFCHEQDYAEALRCVHQGQSLEQLALVSHAYVAMHRTDLAEKQVALMQKQDDDATLTQLANAEALIAKGSGHQEACNIYQDLAEKYGPSPLLLNNMATCHLALGRAEEAEQCLQEALGKNPSDPSTIANLVVCLQHLKKTPEMVARYITQLRADQPRHPWAEAYATLERNFDRAAAQVSR